MSRLDDAHVLITGGSSGIGLATARRALARGARVSIVARDVERLAQAEDTLESSAGEPTRVCAEPADVTDRESIERALGLLIAQLGPVDVLVTCAGGARPGLFEALPAEVFVEQMTLNYLGTVYSVRAVVPAMIERGRGHVMLVSSAAGLVGVYGYSAYVPAKFAVRGFAEALRPELKPHGIVVGCAFPPDTDTPGFAAEEATKPEATKTLSATVRVRSPEDVANSIIRGIERDHLVVCSDTQTALLARGAGLLAPIVRRMMDRHVRRAARSAGSKPAQ